MDFQTGEGIYLDIHETNKVKPKENKEHKNKLWLSKHDYYLDAAVQQFVGYNHASQGFSLLGLVSSMGLTKDEWEEIKKTYDEQIVRTKDFDEIEEYFKEAKK